MVLWYAICDGTFEVPRTEYVPLPFIVVALPKLHSRVGPSPAHFVLTGRMPPRPRRPQVPPNPRRGQQGPAQNNGVNANVGQANANVNPPPPGPVFTIDASMVVLPVTDSSPVAVEAQQALVIRTAFLPWEPFPVVQPAPARCALSTFQMFKVFGSRCRIAASAQARQAAEGINLLNLRLSADAWSRILSCYVDSGLLAENFYDLGSLLEAISRLQLTDDSDLEISDLDWEPGEQFVMPVNAPPQHLLAPLAYLGSASVALLEDEADRAKPWGLLSDLVGALGPCLTQVARGRPTSSVQLVAQRLRAHLGGASISDGAAALGLKDALPDLKLPLVFRSQSLREADLRSELLDAINYHFSSSHGRPAIEARRVMLLGSRCGVFAQIDSLPVSPLL